MKLFPSSIPGGVRFECGSDSLIFFAFLVQANVLGLANRTTSSNYSIPLVEQMNLLLGRGRKRKDGTTVDMCCVSERERGKRGRRRKDQNKQRW